VLGRSTPKRPEKSGKVKVERSEELVEGKDKGRARQNYQRDQGGGKFEAKEARKR